jgi:hypothetical protein
MATPIPAIGDFAQITELALTAAGIANNNAPGHKMLAKLGQGLGRIQESWDAFVAGPNAETLAAMEKFIIVEKYPGGSRRRRQSKKRRNQRNHNNQ